MTAVALEDVSKRYGGTAALDGVTFDVASGERVVLVGPSGCGKTTTLRLVAGLEAPDEGTIRFDGRPCPGLAPRERDVAMVFQRPALYPHRSVADNLAFPLRLRKLPAAQRRQQVQWAAAMLGIETLLDRLPRELSGGQQQRVALGRALVRRPRVFLLDEPLASLDPALRHQVRQEIVALHRRLGTTMLYVTHDRGEALSIAQRLVVLRQGRVEQIGSPEEVYRRPATRAVADLLGRRPVNALRGRVTSCGGQPAVAVEGLDRLASISARDLPRSGQREIHLCFRPEDATVWTGGSSPQDVALSGAVEAVEQLGDEAFVTLRAGCLQVVGRWAGFCPLAAGDAAWLSVAAERLLLFERATDG